jgi:transcriptional regulator with XRE-family HTH domain
MPLDVQLRVYRATHKITQKELAEILGVARAEVNRWEMGRNTPHPKMVKRMIKKGVLNGKGDTRELPSV